MLTHDMIRSAMKRVVEYIRKTYNVQVDYGIQNGGMSIGVPDFLQLNWMDNNRRYQLVTSLTTIPTVGPYERQIEFLSERVTRDIEQKILDWRRSTQEHKNETEIEKSRHEAITQYYEDRQRSAHYHPLPERLITEDECYKKPRKTLLLC